jgi:hypothetical protein
MRQIFDDWRGGIIIMAESGDPIAIAIDWVCERLGF